MTDPHAGAHAWLEWDEQGQPISTHFADVYFSRTNGIDESRFVFVEQNHLPERWQALPAHDSFTVCETGFGTGLNFLTAWQAWLQNAPSTARLHFVSVEKFPLNRLQLEQALCLWPQLREWADQLVAAYPPLPAHGFRRLLFDQGRVALTLIFDDVVEALGQLLPMENPGPQVASLRACWGGRPMTVDAWFFDGFAPAKNPAMWSPAVFERVHQLSGSGTTFATFTAAGAVKRQLVASGFCVEKVDGFGHKRHMLRGYVPAAPAPHGNSGHAPQPAVNSSHALSESWHLVPAPARETAKSAIIVGAGLAGAHTARALAHRGYAVTVLERDRVASGASGNRQGVLYAKLSSHKQALTDFNLLALQFACSYYSGDIGFDSCGQQCGVIQLAQSEKELEDYRALAQRFAGAPEFLRLVAPEKSADVCGLALAADGLFFPSAGWLQPDQLCRELLNHPAITVREHSDVQLICHSGDNWQACDSGGPPLAQAATLVIASAYDAKHLEQTADLPLRPIRGQTTSATASETSAQLASVVCGKGYIAPTLQGQHSLGATFDLHNQSPEPSPADDDANYSHISVGFAEALGLRDITSGRVGFRCASPDYLPLVGPVPDSGALLETFAPLRRSARTKVDATGTYHPNLFVNLAHGSRGLAYTPLSAELLACMIAGEPLPVDREMALRLHPARYLIRDLKRNRR